MNNKQITEKFKKYHFPAIPIYYQEPIPIVSGKGCFVEDVEGRSYLDFFGGILTVSVGHCQETITERVIAQMRKLQHVSTLYPNLPAADLAEKLANMSPGNLNRSFFTNSGTEADETAILTAQHHTGAYDIIALRHCYSGRSALAMAVTAHSTWRVSRIPVAGIRHAVAPYCYRCAFHLKYPECDLACARDMEELIKTTTPGKVAAFIAEPILGVGGFITPPPEYFKVAVDIVRRHGGLFIADEVQTGWGRTGTHWFGIEHYGVIPDIMTSAKGMANGFPIGWTITTDAIAESFKGPTISTFGGNPVSCVAAQATIEYMEAKDFRSHVAKVGAYLKDKLLELKAEFPIIGEVRGMGLMLAIELVTDPKTKTPAPMAVLELFEETKKEGLLIGKGGLYGNVIRISPPMEVTTGQVDDAVKLLRKAFSRLKATK